MRFSIRQTLRVLLFGSATLLLCNIGLAGDVHAPVADPARWAWAPIERHPAPDVRNGVWPRTDVDHFVLSKLESRGLSPASDCDPATFVRRASFVITGLPPGVEEIEAFEKDAAPDRYERLVDRLLASPRFGERWARHWMDLVRYSETLGNEADAVIPNAWRYRDYLIRALNADVPYGQLVLEHVAGDLLPDPRTNPADGSNESVVGTGFFWMNEGKRSPVDVRAAEADCFDNKIDVMGKAFLGLTIGCARCHDHKFDPISSADYYALYGYLKSSRYTQAELNGRALDAKAAELTTVRGEIRRAAGHALAARASHVADCLLAAARAKTTPIEICAADAGLPVEQVRQWAKALEGASSPSHPLYLWIAQADAGPNATPARREEVWNQTRRQLESARDASAQSSQRKDDVELAHFGTDGFTGWFPEDQSFGSAPSRPGDFLMGGDARRPVLTIFRSGAWAHGGWLSRRLEGTLRSPTFTTERRYLHVLAAGRGARINLNIEHFVMIQEPLYGGLRKLVDSDGGVWLTFDLSLWPGRRAYLECADTRTPDLHDQAGVGIAQDAYVALSRAVLSDNAQPPATFVLPAGLCLTAQPAPASLEELASRYQSLAIESLEALSDNSLQNRPDAENRAEWLAWLVENGLLDLPADDAEAGTLAKLFSRFKALEAALPEPVRAPATTDGTPEDEYVFLRGSHKNRGPVVPRRLPVSIFSDVQPAVASGSGRLEMARRMLDAGGRSFVPRVIVNRVWQHVFGRGIVPTPDNFGALGERPTHPELLDFLADRFTRDGQSIKRLVRDLVLSRTFRMSSAPASAAAEEADPDDALLHRMPLRRLEGEAIRDSLLSVAGTLDEKMFGPSVEVTLTPEMQAYIEAYGKPTHPGPIDGAGRRSVYQMIRRNYLSPFMLAFDVPPPLNTAGRRNASNVPAQALILLNDPFVAKEASAWALRAINEEPGDADARVRRMYLQAFARPPSADELADARRFVADYATALNVDPAKRLTDPAVWAGYAHALINTKEFIFVN